MKHAGLKKKKEVGSALSSSINQMPVTFLIDEWVLNGGNPAGHILSFLCRIRAHFSENEMMRFEPQGTHEVSGICLIGRVICSSPLQKKKKKSQLCKRHQKNLVKIWIHTDLKEEEEERGIWGKFVFPSFLVRRVEDRKRASWAQLHSIHRETQGYHFWMTVMI